MIILHLTCALLSYAAFLIACLFGMLFLIQERQLKHKTMGWLFHRLPSLETLDRVTFHSLTLGFGLLSLGVGLGFIGSAVLLGRWWLDDPKAYLTLLLWAMYLAIWLVRWRAAVRGHRVALYSMLGFGLVLLTFVGASRFVPTLHPYFTQSRSHVVTQSPL